MSVALALGAAHMVAEFLLQPDWMAETKGEDVLVRGLHCGFHVAVTVAALVPVVATVDAALGAVTIGVAHFAIDSLPRLEPKEDFELYPMTVDQTLHVASLYGVSVVIL